MLANNKPDQLSFLTPYPVSHLNTHVSLLFSARCPLLDAAKGPQRKERHRLHQQSLNQKIRGNVKAGERCTRQTDHLHLFVPVREKD